MLSYLMGLILPVTFCSKCFIYLIFLQDNIHIVLLPCGFLSHQEQAVTIITYHFSVFQGDQILFYSVDLLLWLAVSAFLMLTYPCFPRNIPFFLVYCSSNFSKSHLLIFYLRFFVSIKISHLGKFLFYAVFSKFLVSELCWFTKVIEEVYFFPVLSNSLNNFFIYEIITHKTIWIWHFQGRERRGVPWQCLSFSHDFQSMQICLFSYFMFFKKIKQFIKILNVFAQLLKVISYNYSNPQYT